MLGIKLLTRRAVGHAPLKVTFIESVVSPQGALGLIGGLETDPAIPVLLTKPIPTSFPEITLRSFGFWIRLAI
jgi:hypothetical protein